MLPLYDLVDVHSPMVQDASKGYDSSQRSLDDNLSKDALARNATC
jgi:hypothetical protein